MSERGRECVCDLLIIHNEMNGGENNPGLTDYNISVVIATFSLGLSIATDNFPPPPSVRTHTNCGVLHVCE